MLKNIQKKAVINLKNPNFISKISLIFLLIFGFSILSNPIFTQSATFISADSDGNVSIPQSSDNVYGAGKNVRSDKSISKDLILAGENVDITSLVTRNILVAGQNITINSRFVGGSVHGAGQTITLTGKFKDDVVIVGKNVILKDAEISGDFVVSAQNLEFDKSSFILGDGFLSYENIKGSTSADQLIGGELKVSQNPKKEFKVDFDAQDLTKNLLNFVWQITLIEKIGLALFLILVCFWFGKKGSLNNPKLGLNLRFLKDILLGLIFPIFAIFFFLVSFILLLTPVVKYVSQFPIAFNSLIFVFGLLGLSKFITPIYFGNILLNITKSKPKQIYIFIAIAYLILFGIDALSLLNPLFSVLLIINVLLSTATAGMVFSSLIKAIKQLLNAGQTTMKPNKIEDDTSNKNGLGVIDKIVEPIENLTPLKPAIASTNLNSNKEIEPDDDYSQIEISPSLNNQAEPTQKSNLKPIVGARIINHNKTESQI
jgi:hypothetical protein